jgi:hypothetical protein
VRPAVERVAHLLGRPPEDIDPGYRARSPAHGPTKRVAATMTSPEVRRARRAWAPVGLARGSLGGVLNPRVCAHATCSDRPVATLTFVYADLTAVLGPLSLRPEPFAYDLCAHHAETMTPPRGWEVIRLAPEAIPASPSPEDLEVLAASVRESARRPALAAGAPRPVIPGARHGHLRVVPGGRATD